MDRLNATIFGEKAVVSLINGERDIMIGIQKGQVVTCSIDVSQSKVSQKNLDYLNLIRKLSIY
jgi:6-phosphofructokinase 1